MLPEEPRLHKLPQAAERLAISLRTLRRHIDLKRVRVVKLGHAVRVSEDEIRRVVRDGLPED